MAKFESSVKQIPFSQEAVYAKLSDLRNLESIRDHLPQDQIQNFTFDADSVSADVPMLGSVAVEVIERDEPTCVKFGSRQSMMPFSVWLQVMPAEEQSSQLKVTVDADIPFLLKPMISGPLEQGVEKIADMLASLDYSTPQPLSQGEGSI